MFKKMSAFILAGMMTIVTITAEAATSGTTGTSTIVVTTKADWSRPGRESITLKNRKVQVEGYTALNKKKIKSYYPSYRVNVRSTDGEDDYSRTMRSGKLKLNLKPNKRYHITVKYDFIQINGFNGLKKVKTKVGPYWWVAETHKVKTCR